MGFFLEFDARNNTVRLDLGSAVTTADIQGGIYAGLHAFMSTRPSCNVIVNLSEVTKVEASGEVIRERAQVSASLEGALMVVLVAPQDFAFGLFRMFSVSAEKTRPKIPVVRSMDEAYRLLGIESPEFKQVSGT